jgi:anti-sigma-K factor RskA
MPRRTNTGLQHAELEELVAAYAIHAAEPDDVAIVEQHLSSCPKCRAELQDMRDTASYLSYVGTDAPDGLWDRIAGQLEAEPPADAKVFPFAAPRENRKLRHWRQATLAAAAIATVLIAMNGLLLVRQSHRIDRIEPRTISALAEQAAADSASRLVPLRSSDGAVTADVVVRPNGSAYLLHSTLPKLSEDKTYQLWGISLGSQPVSLSVLGNAPKVVGFTAKMRLDQFAITVEQAGGVAASQQSPLLLGIVN